MNRTVKNILILALIVAGTCGWASGQAAPAASSGQAVAKDETPERAVVPLSNPAKPAKIEVTVMRGSITIRGYQGKDVIVEARTREKALNYSWAPDAYATGVYAPTPPATPAPAMPAPVAQPAKPGPTPVPAPGQTAKAYEAAKIAMEQSQKAIEQSQNAMALVADKEMQATLARQEELAKKIQHDVQGGVLAQFYQDDKKAKEEKDKKIAGMKRLSGSSSGLEVEEDDNVITINTQSWKAATDLDIQVPVTSSLEIQSSMDGAVVVEGVSGEVDINNINGPVTLRNVSGTTLVHTVNGDIEVALARVAPDKPLSFSTMNGDIDVTLPPDVKANLKMKSEQGEIYSDFDINMTRQPAKSEPTEKTEQGKYRITFDKSLYGMINGGGQEISFNTFRGDIYIRKKK
jgi:hypothetical protein